MRVFNCSFKAGGDVYSEELLPEKVIVSYKAAITINVAEGTIAGEQEYSCTAEVYGEWTTVTETNKQLTLSMGCLLASGDKGAIDVTFKTPDGNDDPVMTHELTNLPYRRNYRTNGFGNFLSTKGEWKVTIVPDWTDEYDETFSGE